MISDKSLNNDVYADFSGFESMRTAARKNDPEAVRTVAKQLEGVFLNMMMSSMREANQLFNEDSLMSSKDVKFYEQMLDQQLSVTLTEGKGIGLADQIVRQIQSIQGRAYDPVNGEVPKIKGMRGADSESSTEKAPSDYSVDAYSARAIPIHTAPILLNSNSQQENDEKTSKEVQPSKEPDKKMDAAASNVTIDPNSFIAVSPQDFVDKIVPHAKKAAAALGVPVESVVAQAALETGWGRYMMKNEDGTPALNFFGIKADKNWSGDQVKVPTVEYRNGIAAKESASFRSYASMDEAFTDYSNFLSQKPRYQQALHTTRENNDAKSWGNLLQSAGYATDPNYGKKIASIVSRLQKDDGFQQRLNTLTNVSR